MTIKLATYNITGILQEARRRQILRLFNEKHLDIVCLQEVKFKNCNILESSFKIISNLGPKKRGTAVLVRKNLKIDKILLEPEGRLISVDIAGLTIVCVYAPSGETNKLERDEFFKVTILAYTALSKYPIVLLGDCNAVENLNERQSAGVRRRQRHTNLKAL